MTEDDGRPARARIVPRPSYREKKRNRRRKTKYARRVFSVAHLLVALNFLLGVGFVIALLRGAGQGADLALESVDTQRLADLNLPGVAPEMRRRPIGSLQFIIWAYLFGTPVLFAIHRGLFWRSTAHGARYLALSALAVWAVVILIVLFTATSR